MNLKQAHYLHFNVVIVLAVLCCCAIKAMAASIVGSKHDVSVGGNNQICAFCHTPHYASTDIAAPLWNKKIANQGGAIFMMYTSATLDTSQPLRPGPLSLACLSCHDGANADAHAVLNAPGSGLGEGSYTGNCAKCHIRGLLSAKLRMGRDMTNDHPISMDYPTPQQDSGFFIPPNLQTGWTDLPLYAGKVECPSCHNVHDPAKAPFLRIVNTASALCYRCHNK